jgi:hypothetical protein
MNLAHAMSLEGDSHEHSTSGWPLPLQQFSQILLPDGENAAATKRRMTKLNGRLASLPVFRHRTARSITSGAAEWGCARS